MRITTFKQYRNNCLYIIYINKIPQQGYYIPLQSKFNLRNIIQAQWKKRQIKTPVSNVVIITIEDNS